VGCWRSRRGGLFCREGGGSGGAGERVVTGVGAGWERNQLTSAISLLAGGLLNLWRIWGSVGVGRGGYLRLHGTMLAGVFTIGDGLSTQVKSIFPKSVGFLGTKILATLVTFGRLLA
jgi:hypothetical protein